MVIPQVLIVLFSMKKRQTFLQGDRSGNKGDTNEGRGVIEAPAGLINGIPKPLPVAATISAAIRARQPLARQFGVR